MGPITLRKRPASPLVEEGLLIGFAIIVIVILATAIFGIVGIAESTISDFIIMLQEAFGFYA
jgi:hypothetical protein